MAVDLFMNGISFIDATREGERESHSITHHFEQKNNEMSYQLMEYKHSHST